MIYASLFALAAAQVDKATGKITHKAHGMAGQFVQATVAATTCGIANRAFFEVVADTADAANVYTLKAADADWATGAMKGGTVHTFAADCSYADQQKITLTKWEAKTATGQTATGLTFAAADLTAMALTADQEVFITPESPTPVVDAKCSAAVKTAAKKGSYKVAAAPAAAATELTLKDFAAPNAATTFTVDATCPVKVYEASATSMKLTAATTTAAASVATRSFAAVATAMSALAFLLM